jgi:hypothetical protein
MSSERLLSKSMPVDFKGRSPTVIRRQANLTASRGVGAYESSIARGFSQETKD